MTDRGSRPAPRPLSPPRLRLPVRPRAFAVAALALVGLELAMRVAAPTWVPHDFRMPDRTLSGFEELVDTTSRADGVRMAVVGDSIVWGGFADRDQTLSARMDADYAAAGRAVHVFNYGMNGAHADDLLPAVALLAGRRAVDVVAINLDYRFYGSRRLVYRYPQLYVAAAPYLDGARSRGIDGTPPRPAPPEGFDATVASAAARVSTIVERRDYLTAATLGDTPADAFAAAFATAVPRLRGEPLWRKRPASRLPLAELRAGFDVPPITEDDPAVRHLVEAVRAARERGVEVVVFAGPIDRDLLADNDLYDPAAYAANLERFRVLIEREGGVFLDLSDSVPAAQIGDSHHPLPAGYRTLARVLAREADAVVRRAQRSRASGRGGE